MELSLNNSAGSRNHCITYVRIRVFCPYTEKFGSVKTSIFACIFYVVVYGNSKNNKKSLG